MKKLSKIVASLLSVCLLAGTAACRDSGDDVPVDETKVQLLVGNFDGGYGSAWLNKAVKRFEAKYADHDFGGGKKGVQITVDNNSRYSGAMQTNMASFPQHVILAENVNYYDMVDITNASSNYLCDISDVVTTPINSDLITGKTENLTADDAKTIAQITNSSMDGYLDVTGNGKYYGVPFYEATVGIVYDLDVFEKYGFYFAAEGYGDSEGFVQDKQGNWIGKDGAVLGNVSSMTYSEAIDAGLKLGNGPDGKPSTYDDGCPATYDDFFKMCLRMNARDVYPLTWGGNPEVQRYLNYLAYNLWTDYEGAENMGVNFSLSGKANLIDMSSFNAETGEYTTVETNITAANGYELQRQAGKYESINFIKRILSDSRNYDQQTCIGDYGQKESERRFILSALPDQKDRAMLIDGSWWQNEASSIFSDMAVDEGNDAYKAENRRFGMLPLPKANAEKVGKGNALAFNTATVIVVNKKAVGSDETVLKVAKQFIKFLHTHESLVEFTSTTASARPFEYTLTDSELNGLTSVAKQNYELHTATDFVFTYSKQPIVRNNPTRFSCSGYLAYESFGKLTSIISQKFIDEPSVTAWDYFKSMVEDHGEKFWKDSYSTYLK